MAPPRARRDGSRRTPPARDPAAERGDLARPGPRPAGRPPASPGRADPRRADTGAVPRSRYSADTGPVPSSRYSDTGPVPTSGRFAPRQPDTGAAPTGRAPGRSPAGPPRQVPDRRWQSPPAPEPPGRGYDEGYDAGHEDDDEAAGPPRRRVRRPGAAAGAAAPKPELPHVDGFDGLRALALLGVLAFHQGFDAARGGFLAISTFFTLSGFLVATVALAEWSQSGRLALTRLWEQRARRILPALVFTVAVVVVLQTALRVGAGPGYRGDVLAALGQVLNWRYVLDGDGFVRTLTDPSPVQHLWSMSMLVQITLVLPLVFVGVMKVTGKRWRAAGGLFAAGAVASFVGAWLTADRVGNDGMAYYGTHLRVGELLVGVVLAYLVLSPGLRRFVESPAGVAAVRHGAVIALLVLAWLWHTTGLYSSNLFAGVTALNALLTAWIVFAVTLPGPAASALGSPPMRLLGTVSYAAYLLHWPLFLLVDEDRLGVGGPLLFLARVAATLVAAALVTFAIERPFRRRVNRRGPQVALALGLTVAVVAAAAFVLPEQPPAGVSLAVDDGNGAGDLEAVAPSGDEIVSIAVVGGTLAGSLPPGFEAWNADHPDQQVRLHTHVADCPLSGPGPVRLAGETVGEGTDCLGFAPRLPRLLDAAEPDVVVVVPSAADLGEREIDRESLHLGDPVFDEWFYQHLRDLADTLDDAGVPVLWATSPHVRLAPGGDLEGDWTSVSANDPARVDRMNDLIRSVAARHDAGVVDLGAWAQRLPRGEFGTEQRAEGRDLTEDGAARAAAWLVPEVLDVLGLAGAGDDEDADGEDADGESAG
ncbi:MAG TPA: acyltransferase family protein [Acidimicrobiales bacterium]